MASYAASVKAKSELYPSLKVLWEFLAPETRMTHQHRSRVQLIEYLQTVNQQCRNSYVSDLQEILVGVQRDTNATTRSRKGCIMIIEDIQSSQVEQLGETLDIDPTFFAGYLGTEFRNVERHALPLWATTLPSELATQESLHLHYQRPVRLKTNCNIPEDVFLISSGNVRRDVKRLSTLGDIRIAFLRSCCSILRKRFDSGFWICLVLLDSTTAKIVPKDPAKLSTHISIIPTPLHTFIPLPLNAYDKQKASKAPADVPLNLLESLVACEMRGLNFTEDQPTMLSLCFHPIRWILREWIIYSITMSRYVKHYEYSLSNLQLTLREGDVHELQTWRRRAFQSLQRISAMQSFVEFWNSKELDPTPGSWMIKDMQSVSNTITYHSRSLESMIPVATSMVQLIDMRRSMQEASHVKQLTYLALIFIPLSYVSGIFSMSGDVAPGGPKFWLYFVVAIPVLGVVLGLSWWRPVPS